MNEEMEVFCDQLGIENSRRMFKASAKALRCNRVGLFEKQPKVWLARAEI